MHRRALGGLLAILGVYYCVLAGLTLARVPTVTDRWIELSGDPEFKYDRSLFQLCIGAGAVLVGALGVWTAANGVAAARGRRSSWLGLAIGAPALHWFWFLYRTTGAGLLDRGTQAMTQRDNLMLFGGICGAYWVMWILTRERRMASQPAGIGASVARRA